MICKHKHAVGDAIVFVVVDDIVFVVVYDIAFVVEGLALTVVDIIVFVVVVDYIAMLLSILLVAFMFLSGPCKYPMHMKFNTNVMNYIPCYCVLCLSTIV